MRNRPFHVIARRAAPLAALFAALSGWLYAHLGRFVSPSSFDAGAGIEYLMMAMIGGAASPLGGLIGAALITWAKNAIQDYLPLIAGGAALDAGVDRILEAMQDAPFIFNLGHGIILDTPIAHVEQVLARVTGYSRT